MDAHRRAVTCVGGTAVMALADEGPGRGSLRCTRGSGTPDDRPNGVPGVRPLPDPGPGAASDRSGRRGLTANAVARAARLSWIEDRGRRIQAGLKARSTPEGV